MKIKFLRNINYALLLSLACAVVAMPFLTSCQDDEDPDQSVQLHSYGPMPIPRGAELIFIGQNLDKVTSVVLPDGIEISEFGEKNSTVLRITVPQNAEEGLVVLKHPEGEITTKTPIGFLETIVIESISPSTIRTDSVLTIKGDYLNLINEVIFTDRIAASGDAIVSKSRGELKVKVPAGAQSGKIALSNGAEEPFIIYSEDSLFVTLPSISSIAPNPVKAGENLTISGKDLKLVKTVIFGGEKAVTEFVSQTETTLVVKTPADAQDGEITVLPASEVAVESEEELTMKLPVVSFNPTTIKSGETITVTGSDLDLIDKVIFNGDFEGEIQEGGSDTELNVVVPDEALSGVVKFATLAMKEVEGDELTIIDPGFVSFDPAAAKAKTNVTITGTDLDLVVSVLFAGDLEGDIMSQSETELSVSVPVGAQSGKITLVAKNGVNVQSASDFTVETNLPDFTGFTEPKGVPGQILTLNGTSLSLIKELIFPGGVKATAYGVKSDSKVEVYVPADVAVGEGSITMITYEGEEGLLPQIFFGGIDPIYDEKYVFFNFNGVGKDSWWGNAIDSNIEDEPSTSADGTPYWRVNGMSGNGWWDGLFFRNGGDNFVTEGVDASDWAVRFDLNTFEAFPNEGDLRIRLENFYYYFNLNSAMGMSDTQGWLTITAPLTDFVNDDGVPLTDPSVGAAEFGMIWSSGNSVKVNIGIDNVRFEPINP